MINSDLLADSLDNEDEDDDSHSNLLESNEECKDELNTPSMFHKGSTTQPLSPQVLEYYCQGNQQFCDYEYDNNNDQQPNFVEVEGLGVKLTMEDEESEQEEFIGAYNNQLEIVIEEDQYCHRQNTEDSDFELSDTLYKQ